MARLLSDPWFEIAGQAPAPNKNYYHFTVTKSEVRWRWWKISPRVVDRLTKPGEQKESHCDFLDDTLLQCEVSMVFGQNILKYTKALCKGQYDYLERLPDSLLLRIINYLELEDVGQLERTSHRFRKLCGSEEFWEQAVRQSFNTVSPEVSSLAFDVGWRSIFYSNKLHLQKLLSRRRLKAEEQQERQVSDPDTKAEENLQMKAEINLVLASEEESLSGTFWHLRTGIGSADGFDPNPDPDAVYESIEVGPGPFTAQSGTQSSAMGDFNTESVKTMS
ncbi:F-box only protein 36b [Cololabis saira]|uniref:F-box only protein 36b n=1 Tax=Cololabis saira TaxID=129043 RepID=UPI002AD218C1|nr:F-box only protein 36b [Cololabis saira]